MEHTESHQAMAGGEYSSCQLAIFLLSILLMKTYGRKLWLAGHGGSWEFFFEAFEAFELAGYKMFVLTFGGYDVAAKHFKPH